MGAGKKKNGAVEDEKEGSENKYGTPKEYDPTFNGPIKNRGCTDIICCLIFVAFLGGQGYIAYLAFTTGDPNTVVYPTDYQGHICGVSAEVKNLTNLFFFDWLACFSYATLMTLKCPTPQVCVESCPRDTYSIYTRYASELVSGDYSNVDWNDFICKYDIDPEHEVANGRTMMDLLLEELCAAYYAASISTQGRCVPDMTSEGYTETPNDRNITEENSDVFGSIVDFLQDSERIESLVDDFIVSLPYIAIALCIVGVVSFLFIILMRWLTNVIVIGSIVALFGLLAWALYFCYDTWLCYRNRDEACNPTSTTDPLMSYQQSENMWLAFAITLSVIAGILFLLCLVLAKRFRVAALLLAEAGSAVGMIKTTLLWPIVPFVLQFGYITFWAFVTVYMASAAVAVFEITNAPEGSGLENGTKCDQETFNASIYAPARCDFVDYGVPNYTIYLQIYSLIGLWWMIHFIIALGEVTLAGAFASYYWAFSKPRDITSLPLISSFWRAIRYHMGSIAFGAIIITILQIIRSILEFIESKVKSSKSWIMKFMFCCCRCCFWCLDRILRAISHNAYIEIAVYGRNFCSSAMSAFKLLMRNILLVTVTNTVTGFMLFLVKTCIVVGITIGAFYFFEVLAVSESETLVNVPQLNNTWVPIVVISLTSFAMTTAFFGVYDTAIDTLLLCFLEDMERNDGSPGKPYYMSKGLKDVMGKKNKKRKDRKEDKKKGD